MSPLNIVPGDRATNIHVVVGEHQAVVNRRAADGHRFAPDMMAMVSCASGFEPFAWLCVAGI